VETTILHQEKSLIELRLCYAPKHYFSASIALPWRGSSLLIPNKARICFATVNISTSHLCSLSTKHQVEH
jgi:hypothetical protein